MEKRIERDANRSHSDFVDEGMIGRRRRKRRRRRKGGEEAWGSGWLLSSVAKTKNGTYLKSFSDNDNSKLCIASIFNICSMWEI